jgi:hypothetical protein
MEKGEYKKIMKQGTKKKRKRNNWEIKGKQHIHINIIFPSTINGD